MTNSLFVDVLTQDFLDWQAEQGERKKVKDYAEYLDMHRVTISRLMSGSLEPTESMLFSLAQKTGNPRYYDFANAPRPDPDLEFIKRAWKRLPEDARKALRDDAEHYFAENVKASVENNEEKEKRPRTGNPGDRLAISEPATTERDSEQS